MSSFFPPSVASQADLYVDGKRLTMSPLKKELHDLIDNEVFENEDLILRQVLEMLREEAERRRLPS